MTIKHIKLVEKKEFAAIAMDPKYEIFVVYITSLNFNFFINVDAYLFCKPQIVGLIAKKVFTKGSIKYTDFVDMFFPDLTSKLSEYTKINNHTIKLVNG